MSKVFIIEPPKQHFDLTSAKTFGEIVYIFSREDRRCSTWEHIKFGRTVLNRLKTLNFHNDKDYICIIGSMLTMSISIIAIAQRYNEFNVLLFHSINDKYVLKRFNLQDWIEQ